MNDWKERDLEIASALKVWRDRSQISPEEFELLSNAIEAIERLSSLVEGNDV